MVRTCSAVGHFSHQAQSMAPGTWYFPFWYMLGGETSLDTAALYTNVRTHSSNPRRTSTTRSCPIKDDWVPYLQSSSNILKPKKFNWRLQDNPKRTSNPHIHFDFIPNYVKHSPNFSTNSFHHLSSPKVFHLPRSLAASWRNRACVSPWRRTWGIIPRVPWPWRYPLVN